MGSLVVGLMNRPTTLLLLLLLLAVVGCDHTTKHLAFSELSNGRPVSLVPEVLSLRYVTNTDTAFGLLERFMGPDARFYAIVISQALVTAGLSLGLLLRWRVARVLEKAAGTLVIGGALGNLTDRMFRGHVVDFIHVSYWPVFNIADVAICVGVGLFIIAAKRDGLIATT